MGQRGRGESAAVREREMHAGASLARLLARLVVWRAVSCAPSSVAGWSARVGVAARNDVAGCAIASFVRVAFLALRY